jgi:hypothetical protein
MSSTRTRRHTNADGFTEEDVAIREFALKGTPPLYDHLLMSIRESFRSGQKRHIVTLGNDKIVNRMDESQKIAKLLMEYFPTSQILCTPDPGYIFGIYVRITFPT